LSRDILHRKAGAGDAAGKGRWSSGRFFEKSAHMLVESPATKAILNSIQENLFGTPLFHVTLESLMDNELKSCIFIDVGDACIAGSIGFC
jgi:hypothetical protein